MPHKVGSRGQVVISKEIREQLGVEPGWLALERIVNDHVEVFFMPPEHSRSLKGSLASYSEARIPPGEKWAQARDKAWRKAARDKIEPRKRAS